MRPEPRPSSDASFERLTNSGPVTIRLDSDRTF
jgi:hypothetical protein